MCHASGGKSAGNINPPVLLLQLEIRHVNPEHYILIATFCSKCSSLLLVVFPEFYSTQNIVKESF